MGGKRSLRLVSQTAEMFESGILQSRLLVFLCLGISLASPAWACTPSPVQSKPITAAQAERAARSLLGNAGAVVEARLVRAPRHRLRGEKTTPPPGILRVEKVLRGQAPTVILIPVTDPCRLNYPTVGERGILLLKPDGSPYPDFVRGPVASSIRAMLNRS